MAKYRKKPIVIEAIQFNGANHLLPQTQFMEGSGAYTHREIGKLPVIIIPTLEGDITARAGDWIIKDVKDKFYPCRNDIFEATYELVEGE